MITFARFLALVLSFFLFGMVVSLTMNIQHRSHVQQVRKYDDANINHMKYGLFSVNVWKEKLTGIIVREIKNFKLNETNKDKIKDHIQGQLGTLIDKVNDQIKKSNEGSVKGWFKQLFMNAFVNVDDIKKGIPEYADSIVQQMTDDKTQQQLKDVIRQRVRSYLDKTFEEQDLSEVQDIMKRVGAKTIHEARALLAARVPVENASLFILTWALIAAAAGLFFVAGMKKGPLSVYQFWLCLTTLFLLLIAGVTCPMIDMIASISEFSFTLLGHQIKFNNQIVYFQSKSILDVFFVLMEDKEIEMKIVGVLMISFSIVFPLIKLSSSIFYFYDIFRARRNRWIRFFVLKSGKWSMTDVQIVAIMMAYIGFNGMVTSQFETLSKKVPDVVLVSTNGTTLQLGFYIFLTYAILAMFLSGMISRSNIPRRR